MRRAYEPYLSEILFDEPTLKQRIMALGEEITLDYEDEDGLLLLCILKGGVMFLTDLSRYIDVPHEIDFMSVASYGKGARESSKQVRIEMDLKAALDGKHVLIVEDIIDSGYTLQFVIQMLQARQPASVRICTLLNKASRREVQLPIDYIGFEIEDKFVFGYGLDLDEKFRNLPFIGVVDLERYDAS